MFCHVFAGLAFCACQALDHWCWRQRNLPSLVSNPMACQQPFCGLCCAFHATCGYSTERDVVTRYSTSSQYYHKYVSCEFNRLIGFYTQLCKLRQTSAARVLHYFCSSRPSFLCIFETQHNSAGLLQLDCAQGFYTHIGAFFLPDEVNTLLGIHILALLSLCARPLWRDKHRHTSVYFVRLIKTDALACCAP